MTLSKNQSKSGYPKGESTNQHSKTGRPSGHDGGQEKSGYPKVSSPPQARRGGSSPSYVPGENYNTTTVHDRGINPERKDLVDNSPAIEGP